MVCVNGTLKHVLRLARIKCVHNHYGHLVPRLLEHCPVEGDLLRGRTECHCFSAISIRVLVAHFPHQVLKSNLALVLVRHQNLLRPDRLENVRQVPTMEIHPAVGHAHIFDKIRGHHPLPHLLVVLVRIEHDDAVREHKYGIHILRWQFGHVFDNDAFSILSFSNQWCARMLLPVLCQFMLSALLKVAGRECLHHTQNLLRFPRQSEPFHNHAQCFINAWPIL